MAGQGGQGINVGGIYADLEINSGKLDQGLAKARAALAAAAKEVQQLDRDLHENAITATTHAQRMAVLSNTINELTTRMQAAYAATTTLNTGLELVTRNGNAMTRSTGQMAQGLMQLGYVVDDLQYGFKSVINNVAPLFGGIGSAIGLTSTATAGLATAAQIAAVAGYQLYVHWDEVMGLFGEGKTLTEAERMEKLAKETNLAADAQERLNRYKREEKAGKDLADKRPEAVEKQEKAVEKAIAELGDENTTGRDKLIAGVIAARRARGEGTKVSATEQEELDIKKRVHDEDVAKFGEQGVDSLESAETLRALQARVQKRLDTEDQERARHTVDTAVFDPLRRTELVNEIKSAPGAFPAGAADDLANIKRAPTKEERDAEAKKKKEAAAVKAAAAKAKAQQTKDEADRLKQLGKQGFLEEQIVLGTASPGEEAEFADLKTKQQEKDRLKQIGKLGVLEELHVQGLTTEGEDEEMKRLKETDDNKKQAAERAKDAARKKNEKDAREASPGIKEQSEILATMVAGGAMTASKARDMISDQLAKNGVGPIGRTNAANDIFGDAQDEVQKDAIHRGLNDRTKHSEVFDANSLAAQFQSSVGGSEAKKQTGILENLQKSLDQMVKMGWAPITDS